MTSSRSLDIVTALFERPGYRQYLWDKLVRRRHVTPHDPSAEHLRLAGGMIDDSSYRSSTTHVNDGHMRRPQGTISKVRDQLFEASPYDQFDPRPYPDDVQGWGSDDPVLVEAIQLLRPTRICEVGSWKGRSAINMARTAKALNLDAEIVCVDTWLGSPEHWLKQDPDYYASLRILNGMPHLYYTFLSNIVRAELSDIITPFPNTSQNAASVFLRLGVQFDLVYIDAAHEYEPAKRDFLTYYGLLADNGLLIGDDYRVWPGVTQAADDFVSEHSLRLIGKLGKCVIPKGDKYKNILFDHQQ